MNTVWRCDYNVHEDDSNREAHTASLIESRRIRCSGLWCTTTSFGSVESCRDHHDTSKIQDFDTRRQHDATESVSSFNSSGGRGRSGRG